MLRSEFERNWVESFKRQLMSMAVNSKTSVWVDSNVLIGSSRADKNRLIKFSNLRTIPQVVSEVSNKPARSKSFLTPFCDQATVVGADHFAANNAGAIFDRVSMFCKCYSPMTRDAARTNFESSGSLSPITNNTLLHAINDSTIFDQAKRDAQILSKLADLSGGVISALDTKHLKKLKQSFLRYTNKREKGLRENTYAWTDELLVASAITDALSNDRIAIILTNDWDPNVVMKQFIDNVIESSVDQVTQAPETRRKIFELRSKEFDKFLRSRRQVMRDATCDGNIMDGCNGGDVFIWQFPTEGIWEFSFMPDFKNRLCSLGATV